MSRGNGHYWARHKKGNLMVPNQPFQSDRDPRERGSRPLNSNR